MCLLDCRELVHGLLQDGYIMVTWANHHYLDFAKSWVYHIKKCGVTGYLVGHGSLGTSIVCIECPFWLACILWVMNVLLQTV